MWDLRCQFLQEFFFPLNLRQNNLNQWFYSLLFTCPGQCDRCLSPPCSCSCPCVHWCIFFGWFDGQPSVVLLLDGGQGGGVGNWGRWWQGGFSVCVRYLSFVSFHAPLIFQLFKFFYAPKPIDIPGWFLEQPLKYTTFLEKWLKKVWGSDSTIYGEMPQYRG